MAFRRVLVVDGYNDEPGGLGVPPYIDVYPRLVAGAIWLADPTLRVDYVTVDSFRSSRVWLRKAAVYDAVVFIAGVVVPGKYLEGEPAKPEELVTWGRLLSRSTRVYLVGPAARWGMGLEGGRPAVSPLDLAKAGYQLVRGDPELFFYDLIVEGEERADPRRVRANYSQAERALIRGARIIRQHPNYGRNLIVEIETYRGCARWVSGGCSFCVEPLRGRPIARDVRGIVAEVEALYRWGARAFRLGRQADILVYGSPGLGSEEWPRPAPEALRRLFSGIRSAAPSLDVLHIDNVNPGTIARYPEESRSALKIIVEHHTDGDVAAMGLESADPKVARLNNLNVTAEEVLVAVRIVNEVGRHRGPRGLPHLLPGLNFILGLPGESRETYRLNRELLERILREGLLVRRVNIRRLLVLPATRVSRMRYRLSGRLEPTRRAFVQWVRRVFDREMLRRIAPPGTLLRDLWVSSCEARLCYLRQTGSYPIVVVVKHRLPRGVYVPEVRVSGIHSARALGAELVSKPPGVSGYQ
jgi:radical SAM superfamily enzyme with C-terminal helix-hairpin-helix motif